MDFPVRSIPIRSSAQTLEAGRDDLLESRAGHPDFLIFLQRNGREQRIE